MERVMLSFGTLSARASRMGVWSLGFVAGLPPPSLAAIWMARQSFDHSLPRRASAAPFLCLLVAQWEGPDRRMIIAAAGRTVNLTTRPRVSPEGRSLAWKTGRVL